MSSQRQVLERLKRELELMNKSPPENCSAGLVRDDDPFLWRATIFGAKTDLMKVESSNWPLSSVMIIRLKHRGASF